jgi:hypothetical protein
MKIRGEKLRALLAAQFDTVTLVSADGTERRGISAGIAAAEIAGKAVTGFGSRGIVSRIVPNNVPRHGPFATRRDLAAMAHHKQEQRRVRRLPRATPRAPGAHSFVPEPRFAHTGHAGTVTTIFRSQV